MKLLPTTQWRSYVAFQPRALPRAEPAPVRLRFSGTVRDISAKHPPALDELVIELDRNLDIDFGAIPACEMGGGRGIRSDVRRGPLEICPSSVIAKGSAAFEIAFPNQAPLQTGSPLTLFKAGKSDGDTGIFLHAALAVPTPADLIAEVKVRKVVVGRYGTRATIDLPKVAGGAGSLTDFTLTIPKRVSQEGEWISVATLRCPDGQVRFETEATFADGGTPSFGNLRTCTPRPPAR